MRVVIAREKFLENLEDQLIFEPIEVSELDSFFGYELIGRELRNDAQENNLDPEYPHTLKEISELSAHTYSRFIEINNFAPPSFIICNSSGTGKTQIPFSLDIPVLYYSLNTEGQPIYDSLAKISRHFKILLERDFEAYCNFIYGTGQTRPYNIQDFARDEIWDKTFPSFTAGFLAQFIPLLFSLKAQDTSSSWLRLQFSFPSRIAPNTLTPAEARNMLRAIAKKNQSSYSSNSAFLSSFLWLDKSTKLFSPLPLVFLDEFNINVFSRDKEKASFVFARNLIRACGLIPVLMGTNSSITNLITSGTASGNHLTFGLMSFTDCRRFPGHYFKKSCKIFSQIILKL